MLFGTRSLFSSAFGVSLFSVHKRIDVALIWRKGKIFLIDGLFFIMKEGGVKQFLINKVRFCAFCAEYSFFGKDTECLLNETQETECLALIKH